MKLKRSKSRVLYYPNTTATFNVILQAGDIESNPSVQFVLRQFVVTKNN